MNTLDQLKRFTTVVADTGDFAQLEQYQPTDATTNPSLILKAVSKPENRELVSAVLAQHAGAAMSQKIDALLIAFGLEILKRIKGRVSTEVDARLSFDTQGSIAKGRELIALYAKQGIAKERVLIKIASTWEGIQAARVLQAEGIRCNMTLLFCLAQAAACAEAKAQLISPFVGRIYDWYKKTAGAAWNEDTHKGSADYGVISVSQIYSYYKQYSITTEVMGASFRNTGQIVALAGCDLLTISPDLLAELQNSNQAVERMLPQSHIKVPAKLDASEKAFRFALNEDAMATEKLAEGIRAFVADTVKLEKLLEGWQ